MRRVGLLAAVLVLVVAGVAVARDYRTGIYKSGAQTGIDKPGVRLSVKAGAFAVKRISYREKCTSGKHVLHDEFNFIAGRKASLVGEIGKHGHFSGRFHSTAGTVKVSGRVHGHKATVDSSETNTFKPADSTILYTCHASHTFHAATKVPAGASG